MCRFLAQLGAPPFWTACSSSRRRRLAVVHEAGIEKPLRFAAVHADGTRRRLEAYRR